MRAGLTAVIVCAGCALAALVSRADDAAARPTEIGFKQFDNSIVPLPPAEQSSVAAMTDTVRRQKLVLHFVFEPRNVSELESRVARGEIVSRVEMRERYAGPKQDFTALLNWLKGQRFEITQTSPDFTGIYARATAGQIGKSLQVEMRQIVHQGKTMPVATTPPRLPIAVGEHVTAIDGLQPFIEAVKHGARPARPELVTASRATGTHPDWPTRVRGVWRLFRLPIAGSRATRDFAREMDGAAPLTGNGRVRNGLAQRYYIGGVALLRSAPAEMNRERGL